MATSSVVNTPECCICLESFKKPKILPCGHTFCLVCIEGYICDMDETFPCPTCQQDVKIPNCGAKEFITNFQLTSKITTQVKDQTPSTTQTKCRNHKQREVDYYCNNCNVGLCSKCILKQHKDHETLDIECDETRNKAIEQLESSQKIIQNRIKNLENTRSTLLESSEQLKSLCEDACAKVTEQTEQIVSDLRKVCQQIINDIRNNLEENRSKVEEKEKEITCDINLLESNMDLIISPSTETTLNILLTLPRFKEIEQLDENSKDYDLCLQYLQWVGKAFNLDLFQLGSVISKSYIPGSYQFLFNVSDIKKDKTDYFSANRLRYNNLVWSCSVKRNYGFFNIGITLLPDDNPNLNYGILDCQLSLLNINNDSNTITKIFSEERLERGGRLTLSCVMWGKRFDSLKLGSPITWSKLTDKNNGYLNSKGQFVVQCDITQIREIEFNQ